MKILQICHKSPFPPAEGGPIAMKAIRDGLVDAGNVVHTFTLSTPKFPVSDNVKKNTDNFSFAFIDNSIRVLPALKDLCLNKSYNISRFYDKKIANQIEKLIVENNFDTIIIESVFMMPYFDGIKKIFNKPIILRAHNIEHLIWKRLSENTSNILKKIYLKILSRQLRKYEINSFKKVNAIASISDVDTNFILNILPDVRVETISFAIKIKEFEFQKKEFTATFGHLGSMDWKPNLEGIAYFIDNVLPTVKEKIPHATFHIAGRNMPEKFKTDMSKGLIVHGEVESAEKFISSLDALVVPLYSGSGIRIKIVEAMSMGMPVITTVVGAEGLNVENGKDIFICNSDSEMIETILNCCNNSNILDSIPENAKKNIALHHSFENITKKLISLMKS